MPKKKDHRDLHSRVVGLKCDQGVRLGRNNNGIPTCWEGWLIILICLQLRFVYGSRPIVRNGRGFVI